MKLIKAKLDQKKYLENAIFKIACLLSVMLID